MNNRYITADEAAKILGVHPRTLKRFLITGKLKGTKVGRSWRLDEKDVHEFFENLKAETAKAIEQQGGATDDK